MSDFMKDLDEETIKAGEQFIKDLKAGKYINRHVLVYNQEENSAKDYPLDKAAESFKHFITTDVSKKISEVE